MNWGLPMSEANACIIVIETCLLYLVCNVNVVQSRKDAPQPLSFDLRLCSGLAFSQNWRHR